MNWPVAVVLIALTAATIISSLIAVNAMSGQNRRLMRALFARQDYGRLEAREYDSDLVDTGVPPSMME